MLAFESERTAAILRAAVAVHRELGRGFLEAVYGQALAIEFERRGVAFEREVSLPVTYRGVRLDARYRVDFVCYRTVVLELKAASQLSAADEAQLLNYLKAGSFRVGLLLNFDATTLGIKRMVR